MDAQAPGKHTRDRNVHSNYMCHGLHWNQYRHPGTGEWTDIYSLSEMALSSNGMIETHIAA